MSSGSRTITFLASMCATSVVAAQVPPKTVDPDVVVTARDQAERKQEARDFVRSVSATPIDGQLARWHVPLCPAVLGVAPEIAGRVQDRVRAVAMAARAPLGRDGCKPNAFVVFTQDAPGLLKVMESREPSLLRELPLPDARALRASRAPVIWWSGTITEGANGDQLQSNPNAAFGVIGTSGPAIPMTERTKFGDSYTSSLILTSVRVAIGSAVVLVDVPASTGHRLNAVADYAAFVILARVRPRQPQGSASTILKLFSADTFDRPTTLTDFDRTYLSALYNVAPNKTALAQREHIIDAVQKR